MASPISVEQHKTASIGVIHPGDRFPGFPIDADPGPEFGTHDDWPAPGGDPKMRTMTKNAIGTDRASARAPYELSFDHLVSDRLATSSRTACFTSARSLPAGPAPDP